MNHKVARLWQCWASGEDALAYERMLIDRILPEIRHSKLPGLLSMTLMKRPDGDEIHYQTILVFSSLEDIKAFAGEDAERAHLDPQGLKLLSRWDERARHYEIIDEISVESPVE
jgi:heme-degrading monooxygenase HmoA